VVHVDGQGVQPDLDAHLLQPLLRVLLESRHERRQHGPGAFQQDDPRLVRVHGAIVPGQHGVRQLRDLRDQLNLDPPMGILK